MGWERTKNACPGGIDARWWFRVMSEKEMLDFLGFLLPVLVLVGLAAFVVGGRR